MYKSASVGGESRVQTLRRRVLLAIPIKLGKHNRASPLYLLRLLKVNIIYAPAPTMIYNK